MLQLMRGFSEKEVGRGGTVARSLECPDERSRILSLDAKPEAGIVAEIGTGLVFLKSR